MRGAGSKKIGKGMSRETQKKRGGTEESKGGPGREEIEKGMMRRKDVLRNEGMRGNVKKGGSIEDRKGDERGTT